ncbi:MAG: glycosyltransferase, partial [Microbacteriaceae bacterium]
MSPIHQTPSLGAIVFGRIMILLIIFSWLMYVITTIVREFLNNGSLGFRFGMEAIFYLVVVTGLGFSALMYLTARQGALYRVRDHVRVPRGVLDRHFSSEDPKHSIT